MRAGREKESAMESVRESSAGWDREYPEPSTRALARREMEKRYLPAFPAIGIRFNERV